MFGGVYILLYPETVMTDLNDSVNGQVETESRNDFASFSTDGISFPRSCTGKFSPPWRFAAFASA